MNLQSFVRSRVETKSVALCLYLSVSLSFTSPSSTKMFKRIALFLAWRLLSTFPLLCLTEIRVSSKLRNFPQTLDLENLVTVSRSCYQQNLSTVETVDHTYDGRRVVVGRT